MLEQIKETLNYINITPISDLDLDLLLNIIEAYNQINMDPNEECPFQAAMIGDIEVAYINAEYAQINK